MISSLTFLLPKPKINLIIYRYLVNTMITNFVKGAGEKLWDKITGEDEDREKAEKITQFINDMDLEVSDLKADVEDDAVTLHGKTKTQEAREKVILAAGNVEGVSKVNDKIKVIPDEGEKGHEGDEKGKKEPRFYTVKKGDTLSEIAQEYYGDPQKYPKIFEANRPMLKDPDRIYPGQTLRIPH